MKKILEVKNLQTNFYVNKGVSHIVNGLTFSVKEGELLGIVGESGSGKSVAAASIMGSVKKPGRIDGGEVIFDEKVNLLRLSEKKLREYRGKKLSLIAANARGHLNPLLTVGQQISNVYMAHNKCSKKEAWEKTVKMLEAVGLTDPEQRAVAYPHELSGGMAQRCMIAMALINSPDFLIADDATNGLDVTVQAQIMDLITMMMKERGMSGVFITHDLGVVAQCCNEIAIIYCGQIIEQAPVKIFYKNTVHPYSINLLNSLPENKDKKEHQSMGNYVSNPLDLPKGCLFHPRCKYATDQCRTMEPAMKEISENHFVKCHFPEGMRQGGEQ